MKILLRLLKPLYLFAVTLDRLIHKVLPFLVFKADRKIVSIGNLTTGGTGKTPVLFELTKELYDCNPCVISRGYRSGWENSFFMLHGKGPHSPYLTDEALLFNRKFPDIPLVLGKRRDRSVKYAIKHLNPGLFILDDGFQFRKLHKDIEIFLWDSLTSPYDAELLPAGVLRESAKRIADADVILLTRCESASSEQIQYWESWLKRYAARLPIIRMQTCVTGLYSKSHKKINLKDYPKTCAIFCAIGNPDSFMEQLIHIGIEPTQTYEFRDHHRFSEKDLQKLSDKAKKAKLPFICTEKDMIKIPEESALDFYYLSIKMVPCSGRSLLSELSGAGIII
jgi:tetraacyldisaccharide 4'-kinase